jgi:predicted regulator of Ras-like GTPase activity (Roadblock/LC7/MglB family)
MPWETVLPLLPQSAVRTTGNTDLTTRVRLPLKQILPQLSKGRVVVPLSDLLSQLPAELRTTTGPHSGTEKISLPIEQVVANLSPEALQARSDQREIEIEESEIPVPFTEEPRHASLLDGEGPLVLDPPATRTAQVAEPVPQARQVEPPTTTDAAEMPSIRIPLIEPAAIRDVAPPTPTPAQPSAQGGEAVKPWIYLTLASVLDSIPNNALAADRELIRSQVDGSYQIPVQADQIIGQLSKGRIELDLGKLASKFPEGVLIPNANGQITLGVDKVIDQLPANVFSQDTEAEAPGPTFQDIPDPFRETNRATQPATPTVKETPPPACIEAPPAPQATEAIAEQDIPQILFAPVTPPPAAEPVSETTPVPSEPRVELPCQTVPVVGPVASAPVEPPAAESPAEPVAEQELDDLDSIETTTEPVASATEPPQRRVSAEEIARALNDVNAWTAEDFHRHTLGPTLSQRIIAYRTQRGGFQSLRELLQIGGIGPRVFEKVLGFSPSALEDEAHAINRLLGVPCDHEMSLQEIVKCASQLPGVEGCIVAMGDGLYMTGELPGHMDSQRVSAFAPQLFGRVAQYVRELNVGTARRLTIFTDAQPITIFKANDLFFIVIHKANRFSKVLLNKCERISQEISRICSKETAKE